MRVSKWLTACPSPIVQLLSIWNWKFKMSCLLNVWIFLKICVSNWIRTPLLLSSRTYTKFLGRIHIKLLIMHHIMFTLISHGSLQLSRNVFSSSWDCAISMANRSSLIHSEWHERKRSRWTRIHSINTNCPPGKNTSKCSLTQLVHRSVPKANIKINVYNKSGSWSTGYGSLIKLIKVVRTSFAIAESCSNSTVLWHTWLCLLSDRDMAFYRLIHTHFHRQHLV